MRASDEKQVQDNERLRIGRGGSSWTRELHREERRSRGSVRDPCWAQEQARCTRSGAHKPRQLASSRDRVDRVEGRRNAGHPPDSTKAKKPRPMFEARSLQRGGWLRSGPRAHSPVGGPGRHRRLGDRSPGPAREAREASDEGRTPVCRAGSLALAPPQDGGMRCRAGLAASAGM